MEKIKQIICTFGRTSINGIRCALVAVVRVESSFYRRPEIRMLFAEERQLTGSFNGECLKDNVEGISRSSLRLKNNTIHTRTIQSANHV